MQPTTSRKREAEFQLSKDDVADKDNKESGHNAGEPQPLAARRFEYLNNTYNW